MMRAETSTRYVGWCPVCERDIKVRQRALVHHGYERPGWGHIVGDCPGVMQQPYEIGTGACEHYLKWNVLPSIAEARERLNLLTSPDGPPTLLFDHYDIATRRMIYRSMGDRREPERIRLTRAQADALAAQLFGYDRDRYSWDRKLQAEIRRTQVDLERALQEQARMNRLIETWTPKPLRTVEEEVQRQEQSRAEREAARSQAKDQKITAEVVKIRGRIDSAVRRKNAAALADIYDSTKLQALSGWQLSKPGALALLERDGIWRAFGLLGPGGYLERAEAQAILDQMKYGKRVPPPPGSSLRFDTIPFPWPVELGGGIAKGRR